jgi:hypothetical protein
MNRNSKNKIRRGKKKNKNFRDKKVSRRKSKKLLKDFLKKIRINPKMN